MELYENTHKDIERLTELKKDFSELAPETIKFLLEKIKNEILNPVKRKTINWDENKHFATKQLIEKRDALLSELDILLLEVPEEPQTIPEELQTEEAKKILEKAVELNLCTFENNVYKWKKSKVLLAYFADLTSEHLNLGKGTYGKRKKTSWKPFELLFGVSGLSLAEKDYQRTGNLPIGYEVIDTIFG